MVNNYLTLVERQEIEQAVNELLLNIGMSYPDNSLLDIAKTAIPGLKVVEDDFGNRGIRGVIFKKSKEFANPMIAIQKRLSPGAKTFTLAHELGHYLLNHPGSKNYLVDKVDYDGSRRAQIEAKAQYFAAALLMPEDKFSWLAGVLDDYKLAKRFGVTVAAVRIRKDWLKRSGYTN